MANIPGTNIPIPGTPNDAGTGMNPYPWETGGGQTPTDTTTPAPDTSQRDQQLAALAAQNGGFLGSPTAVTTPLTGAALQDAIKNKQPTTQDTGFDVYTFGNGASVEATPDGQFRNWKAPSSVERATSVSAPSTEPNIVTRDAAGNVTTQPNPNYVQPKASAISTNTTDPKIVMQDPQNPGNLVTVD